MFTLKEGGPPDVGYKKAQPYRLLCAAVPANRCAATTCSRGTGEIGQQRAVFLGGQ